MQFYLFIFFAEKLSESFTVCLTFMAKMAYFLPTNTFENKKSFTDDVVRFEQLGSCQVLGSWQKGYTNLKN